MNVDGYPCVSIWWHLLIEHVYGGSYTRSGDHHIFAALIANILVFFKYISISFHFIFSNYNFIFHFFKSNLFDSIFITSFVNIMQVVTWRFWIDNDRHKLCLVYMYVQQIGWAWTTRYKCSLRGDHTSATIVWRGSRRCWSSQQDVW